VKITAPDGTQNVIMTDSYQGDTTAWFEYIPDQVGEWTLKFEFSGNYFPPGLYRSPRTGGYTEFPQSVYYEPSSTGEQTLTVQEDIVYSWPEAELPTDYWTRPISLEKREWWIIAGAYPGTGYVGGGPIWDTLYPGTNPRYSPAYDFHPWVEGPNTSHIVWKRQDSVAGLIGGYAYYYGETSRGGTPSVIYSGRCYQTITMSVNGVPTSCAACYDLRTGEMYYSIPTEDGGVTPTIVSYSPPGSGSVPGAVAQTTYSVELLTISGGYLYKIDKTTGAVSEYSISPLAGSGGTYYMNQYVLDVQDLGEAAGEERYRLINWTTAGRSNNFESRVVSNTTYGRASLTETEYEDDAEVAYRFARTPLIDFNAGYGATVGGIGYEGPTRVYEQMRIQGYNLYTGEELWDLTTEEPLYSRSVYIADHGKIAVLTQNGYFLAYDLATGNLAWKSETMDYPWASAGFGAYAIESAYGMLFRQAYDGVYAFDWDDGSIVWHYKAPSLAVYESPYVDSDGNGVYPFNGGATIADGKMYVYNTEHTASWPMTRGWGLHCIDIFTGELVWKIGNPMSYGAIADGYLTAFNSWDGYMYVFGKGQSVTTVTAPDVAVPVGTTMTIKGTVFDMSPAQEDTPCVSEDSMSTQMQYLHLQRPIDGIWHNETIIGVPVSLTAIGEDGSYIDIGTATTDGYSGTFGKAWTPTAEGTYKIVASFGPDESYGSSSATTWVTVGPAPTPSTPIEPEPETPTPEQPKPEQPKPEEPTPEEPTPEQPEPETTVETPLISTELAIIIAIVTACIIGAVAYIALRRRK